MMLDNAMSCEAVAKVPLPDANTVRRWCRLYQEDGIEGLANFAYKDGASDQRESS